MCYVCIIYVICMYCLMPLSGGFHELHHWWGAEKSTEIHIEDERFLSQETMAITYPLNVPDFYGAGFGAVRGLEKELLW